MHLPQEPKTSSSSCSSPGALGKPRNITTSTSSFNQPNTSQYRSFDWAEPWAILQVEKTVRQKVQKLTSNVRESMKKFLPARIFFQSPIGHARKPTTQFYVGADSALAWPTSPWSSAPPSCWSAFPPSQGTPMEMPQDLEFHGSLATASKWWPKDSVH